MLCFASVLVMRSRGQHHESPCVHIAMGMVRLPVRALKSSSIRTLAHSRRRIEDLSLRKVVSYNTTSALLL